MTFLACSADSQLTPLPRRPESTVLVRAGLNCSVSVAVSLRFRKRRNRYIQSGCSLVRVAHDCSVRGVCIIAKTAKQPLQRSATRSRSSCDCVTGEAGARDGGNPLVAVQHRRLSEDVLSDGKSTAENHRCHPGEKRRARRPIVQGKPTPPPQLHWPSISMM